MGGPRHLGVLFRANSPYRHPTTEIEVLHDGDPKNIPSVHTVKTSEGMFGCIYRAGIIKSDPFWGDQTLQMYAKYEGIPP